MEIVRGLDPNKDDRQIDNNSDGTSNYEAFTFGLNPFVKFKDLMSDPVQRLSATRYSVNFQGYNAQTLTGEYTVSVDNLPLVQTLATPQVPDNQRLYYSKVRTPSSLIPDESSIQPSAHLAGENEILFVGKVTAVQDSQLSYWIFHRVKVMAPGIGKNASINIDFSTFKELGRVGN